MNKKDLSYKDYVSDETQIDQYSEYQRKYSKKIRESDKELIGLIQKLSKTKLNSKGKKTLLDVGCSTGNLLLHIKNTIPEIDLVGGDIVSNIIKNCKKNPELEGISFKVMNMLKMSDHISAFDFVVVNASLMFFKDEEFETALKNLSSVTKKGGYFLAFDYFHPFEQEISMVEKSKLYPSGLKLYFRSYSKVDCALKNAGFKDWFYNSFNIPTQLEKPEDLSDITTYTIDSKEGNRLCFRGSIFQPWCFLIAKK